MNIHWRSASSGLRHADWTVKGYDCRTQCEHEHKGDHGWHCDTWCYAVSDGRCSLVLCVFSAEFSDRPDLTVEWKYSDLGSFRHPRGIELSLHVPAQGDDECTRECEMVEGRHCVTPANSILQGEAFWDSFRIDCIREQPFSFWASLEARFRKLLAVYT